MQESAPGAKFPAVQEVEQWIRPEGGTAHGEASAAAGLGQSCSLGRAVHCEEGGLLSQISFSFIKVKANFALAKFTNPVCLAGALTDMANPVH